MIALAAVAVFLGAGWLAALAARAMQRRLMANPSGGSAVTAVSGDGSVAGVATRLGGFEAWKLLLHPVFLVGLALTAALFVRAGWREILDLSAWDSDTGVNLVPFAWGAMVAANLGALRSRRDGVDELLTSLPAAANLRTLGHLVSGFGALGVAIAVITMSIANEILFRDAIGAPNIGELTIGPMIVLGGCFLGVLTARWVPSAIVGVLLVIATFAVEGVTGSSQTSPARWLQFWVQVQGEDGGHPFPGPSDWHVLYLLGLVGIGAAVALARHGVTRPVAGLGGVALLAAGIGGWAQTRQPSESEVRRQAAVYTRTPDVCETRGGVRYCVNDGADRIRFGQWEKPVQAVLARVPEGARRRLLVVSERRSKIVGNSNCTPTPALELLAPRVRPLLNPNHVWPDDGDVHPVPEWPWDSECSFEDHGIVLTAQVGAWAVGLPPTQSGTTPPCRADRQARSVLALWLAGQGHPRAHEAIGAVLQESRNRGLGVAATFDAATWPNWGVAWADADMALALELLKQPGDDVGRVVAANWDRLVDPATPSTELARLVGVTGPAPLPAPEFHGNLAHLEKLTDRIVGTGLPSCP